MNRNFILFCAAVIAVLAIGAAQAYAAKPLPPLDIKISADGEASPGSVVDLVIEVRPMTASEEMSVEIRLTGRVEYVSGELVWRGPVRKGEVVSLPLSVRVPQKGAGEVKARAFLSPAGNTRFSASDRLHLPPKEIGLPSAPPVKRDGRGREILEYRP